MRKHVFSSNQFSSNDLTFSSPWDFKRREVYLENSTYGEVKNIFPAWFFSLYGHHIHTEQLHSNLDIANKSVRPFLFTISNVICLVNPQNGSYLGFVQYITKFTILRLVISWFECTSYYFRLILHLMMHYYIQMNCIVPQGSMLCF